MLITIYSDGSFNNNNHTGGWAVFIESPKGRLAHYGSCPDFVGCSNHAELFAIYMAISLAYREWGDEIHAIRIRSDSDCALRHARKGPLRAKTRDREMLKIRGWIHDLYSKLGVQVLAEHVKAHQDPGLGHEFAMNNRVDRMATRGRKSMTGNGYMRVREALSINQS